jgi:hypothetical protein
MSTLHEGGEPRLQGFSELNETISKDPVVYSCDCSHRRDCQASNNFPSQIALSGRIWKVTFATAGFFDSNQEPFVQAQEDWKNT